MWPFLKWILLIVPSLVMAVVGRILAPILPFFADENARLPSWLSWFSTPNSDLDGDRRHRERWPGDDAFHTWLRRTAWLLRNVAYGFDRTVCGIELRQGDDLKIAGDPDVGDLTGVSGWCWRTLWRAEKFIGWQIYAVWHYQIFGMWKCIRFGLGWKLWGDLETKGFAQYFLYFHPFKSSGRK